MTNSKPMKVGSWLFTQVRKAEGLSLKPYLCPAGKPTIGYGHTGTAVTLSMPSITTAQAEAWLLSDCTRSANIVKRWTLVPLRNNQLEALAGFVFNLGGRQFQRSTMLKKLNKADYAGAAEEILRWDKATVNGKSVRLRGLTARRKAERAHFLSIKETTSN